jgi:hypothetical protein
MQATALGTWEMLCIAWHLSAQTCSRQSMQTQTDRLGIGVQPVRHTSRSESTVQYVRMDTFLPQCQHEQSRRKMRRCWMGVAQRHKPLRGRDSSRCLLVNRTRCLEPVGMKPEQRTPVRLPTPLGGPRWSCLARASLFATTSSPC